MKRKELIFDGDGSQFLESGHPCSLCGHRLTIDGPGPRTFIRVREKTGANSREIGFLCPDCVARAFLQVSRLGLWTQVRAVVLRAIRSHFEKANVMRLNP